MLGRSQIGDIIETPLTVLLNAVNEEYVYSTKTTSSVNRHL